MDLDCPDHAQGPANREGQPGIAAAALSGLRPRCGARTRFAGVARFASRCRACGPDFSRFNSLTLTVVVLGLRVPKAALLASEFRNRWSEGRPT